MSLESVSEACVLLEIKSLKTGLNLISIFYYKQDYKSSRDYGIKASSDGILAKTYNCVLGFPRKPQSLSSWRAAEAYFLSMDQTFLEAIETDCCFTEITPVEQHELRHFLVII